MRHLLKMKFIHFTGNVNILASTNVPFRPTMVQVPYIGAEFRPCPLAHKIGVENPILALWLTAMGCRILPLYGSLLWGAESHCCPFMVHHCGMHNPPPPRPPWLHHCGVKNLPFPLAAPLWDAQFPVPFGCTTKESGIPPLPSAHHCGLQNCPFPLAAPLMGAESPPDAPLWDAQSPILSGCTNCDAVSLVPAGCTIVEWSAKSPVPSGCTTVGCRILRSFWLHHRTESPVPLAALPSRITPFTVAAPLCCGESSVPSGCTTVQNPPFLWLHHLPESPPSVPLWGAESSVPSGYTTVQNPLFPLAVPPYRIPFSIWLCHRTESPFPSGCTTVQNPLFPLAVPPYRIPSSLWLHHRTESPCFWLHQCTGSPFPKSDFLK
jgi:hypothetical protein